MSWLQSFILLLGRVCLAALFLFVIYYNAVNWDAVVQTYKDQGIVQPQLVLIVATLIQLFGGVSLLFGWRVRIGAFLLLFVVVAKSMVFHDFWNKGEEASEIFNENLMNFAANLGVIGGLLYVLACGAGRCSCDRPRKKEEPVAEEQT